MHHHAPLRAARLTGVGPDAVLRVRLSGVGMMPNRRPGYGATRAQLSGANALALLTAFAAGLSVRRIYARRTSAALHDEAMEVRHLIPRMGGVGIAERWHTPGELGLVGTPPGLIWPQCRGGSSVASQGGAAGKFSKPWPIWIGCPVVSPSTKVKPRGANTMIVEPCWNQPISWPLLKCAAQGNSVGPW